MPDYLIAIQRLEALKRDLGKIAANEMVNQALDNIKAGNDINGKPFTPRSAKAKRNQGRAILVDTGAGRRSIRGTPTSTGATLTANEYMQAHNTGVHQRVNVRAHSRTRKGRSEKVASFERTMNLPQRQWTGKSDAQTARIEKVIANQIVKALT